MPVDPRPAALCALLFCLFQGAAMGACDSRADVCQLGEVSGAATCELFEQASGQWRASLDTGPGQLHNRARAYLPWLRGSLMPAGGVMSAIFADDLYQRVASYGGERDAAIWTGAYLASESLRYLATGATDAREQIERTARVLHHWWNIPGDRGYLARFAAPSSSPAEILATLPADDAEVHQGWIEDGILWNWRGNVSRDQYQGVLLGYSLAYEALADGPARELLRADLVAFAEQLMQRERRQVRLIVDGRSTMLELDLENVVYATADMPDGMPTLEINTGSGEVSGQGILVFWPNPSLYVRQIPGFGWLPDIPLATQAMQLGAAFQIALRATEGVPEYADRRAALAEYYAAQVETWLAIAERWEQRNRCGDGYHGLNIGFMPMYRWAALEPDPARRERLRRILGERMWPAVAADKNVWFAFIHAALNSGADGIDAIVAEHVAQLAGFPAAPNRALPVDLTGLYPEDPACPGQSSLAVDVGQRPAASFLWERQPWKLTDPGVSNRLYGGVDYLLAYWLGRYHGFIEDDAAGTCLAYRASALPAPGALEIPQPDSFQTGIGLVSGWFCDTPRVEIQIDGGRLISAAHGSERADTRALCGDTDNGFSFPINYNALADGEHQIAVYADGQPFASARFNVRTLGREFLDGRAGEFPLGDFPAIGQRTLLRWQTASQNFAIAGIDSPPAAAARASASGYLEVPQPGSDQSGIGLIAGWHCDGGAIQIQIDGGRLIDAPHGTERADTQATCGDINNGFGFLINYNALGDGPHEVRVLAAGQLFGGASFNVQTLGQEFATGLTGQARLVDFPDPGLATLVRWQEANQGFVIDGIAPVSE